MLRSDDRFSKDVLACVTDINDLLPELVERHGEQLIVLTAFAEHVGAALSILIRKGTCSVAQAKKVVERIESTALATRTEGREP